MIVFSSIPQNTVAAIYNTYKVLVKFSKVEGLFAPPLEMIHCDDTAITFNVTGYDEYMVDGVNSIIVPMDDEDKVIENLNELKLNSEKLKILKHNALITASNWYSWEEASVAFQDAILYYINNPTTTKNVLENQIAIINGFSNEIERLSALCPDQVPQWKKIAYRIYKLVFK